MCVCVCVFFPFILHIKFVGRTSRSHTGGRSHRISHPHSFCGCCCCLKKNQNAPRPSEIVSHILVANPKKKLLNTVANPARGLLNRETKKKKKVWPLFFSRERFSHSFPSSIVLQFLPPFAPEFLVSRGGFGFPSPRRLAHLTRPS